MLTKCVNNLISVVTCNSLGCGLLCGACTVMYVWGWHVIFDNYAHYVHNLCMTLCDTSLCMCGDGM